LQVSLVTNSRGEPFSRDRVPASRNSSTSVAAAATAIPGAMPSGSRFRVEIESWNGSSAEAAWAGARRPALCLPARAARLKSKPRGDRSGSALRPPRPWQRQVPQTLSLESAALTPTPSVRERGIGDSAGARSMNQEKRLSSSSILSLDRDDCRRITSRAISRTLCSWRPPRLARSSKALACALIKKAGVDAPACNPC